MSSPPNCIEALEYRDVDLVHNAPAQLAAGEPEVSEPVSTPGVPKEEVERLLQLAREEAVSQAEERIRLEIEQARQAAEARVSRSLRELESERAKYFRRIEREVVQLALAIARKILQRESALDPTLLAALVRIALDQMQSESTVRLRVAPAEVDRWKALGKSETGEIRWDVVADDHLEPADCIVETELGTANFSLEAQLRDVEQSFAQLLAHRPAA